MSGGTKPESQRPHVLFAILDWGMGHATRTWPLIVTARELGAEVTIASRGTAAKWLDARMAEWDQRHPQAWAPWRRIDKPGVTITYAKGWGTLPRIASQMPGFLSSIARERRWTADEVKRRRITHVFSDNCYGCHSGRPEVPSILMSHQLRLPVPALLALPALWQVRRWAKPFDAVWVPDFDQSELAGPLSNAVSQPTEFIGPLSRFQVFEADGNAALDHPAPLLGLVSGPEPQRTRMEEALRACFLRDGRPALIFAGKPEGGRREDANVLTIHDADDAMFRAAILGAEHILCRSGYSTLLDLVVLGRTATLIPTIGQPEQEDLAKRWNEEFGWPTLKVNQLATHRLHRHDSQRVDGKQGDWKIRLASWLSSSPCHETNIALPSHE